MRLCVISVHYYAGYLERSLKALGTLCAGLEPVAWILVSNHPDVTARLQREAERRRGVQVVQHDNTGLEFGAYQAGIDRMRSSGEADWYVIVNDTFSIHDCFATPLRDGFVRAIRAGSGSSLPIVVGQVDESPRSFVLGGVRTHRWVRSNVMALNAVALRTLEHRLHEPALDALIRTAGDVADFFSPELDPVLRDRIETWLFSRDPAWGWYQAAPLTAASAPRLARKARSILQEKNLSARLDGASTIFIDVKQLSWPDGVRRGLERRFFYWRKRYLDRRQRAAVS